MEGSGIPGRVLRICVCRAMMLLPVPQLEKIPVALATKGEQRKGTNIPFLWDWGDLLAARILPEAAPEAPVPGWSSSHLPGPQERCQQEQSSLVFQGNSSAGNGAWRSLLCSLAFRAARAASATYQTLRSQKLLLARWEQPGSVPSQPGSN